MNPSKLKVQPKNIFYPKFKKVERPKPIFDPKPYWEKAKKIVNALINCCKE